MQIRCVSILVFSLVATQGLEIQAASSVGAADLRCEYLRNPLGLDVAPPRLSWKLLAANPRGRGQRQTAYHVLVAGSRESIDADKGNLWDSGELASDQSTHVAYRGKPLTSGQRCFWKVRVRDEKGAWSEWSDPARWTMGLLSATDWAARWIGADQTFERKKGWPPPDNILPDPWFRKSFELPSNPHHGVIHVASVGYHEIYVNGRRVGDAVLSPSATDHKRRARYVTYEIGNFLQRGRNVIALWLGTSWSIFPPYKTDDKPQAPIVIAQADIELSDGRKMRLGTDSTWKTHPSPNTLLGVWDFMHFGGELYDANKEVPGWNEVGLDDSGWKPASVFTPRLALSAEKVEPNRLGKEIRPVALNEVSNGVFRVDMGVNFAGFLEVQLKGRPGSRVDFYLSEREDQEMTHRLHSAYLVGPSGQGTFRNRFNYGSGRWVTIRGLEKKPSLKDIRGWLVRTDYERVGQFECNVPLLNRIYETTLWTFENLSVGGYVVDCPQRERMGYGGDAHATTPAGLNNYALGAFYTKWSEDWRDVQGSSSAWGTGANALPQGGKQIEDGNLPYTAPTYWGGGGPGWSGICVMLPWWVYRQYGDIRVLEQNFNTLERWLGFLETKATNDILRRWGGQWDFLGDWLWPGAKGVNGDTVETLFFNNCYWIYNLQTAARIADVLGKTDQAVAWRQRADAVRAAVHAKFHNAADPSYVNGFQAYLAIALLVDLPPGDLRSAVWKRLEQEILVNRQGHIWAGITGGAFLFNTLLEGSRNDLIYTMARQEDYPGWAFMLNKGATTLWEAWEQDDHSKLHSSYLYVGAWFIEGLGGIKPDPEVPGFKRFIIRPGICGQPELSRVDASYDSLHGRIASAWEIKDGRLNVHVTVPPNTQARLFLPVTDADAIRESSQPLEKAAGVKQVARVADETEFLLEPGRFSFVMPGVRR